MFDILSCQLVTRAATIFSVQTDTPPLSTINKVNQIQVQASFTFIDHLQLLKDNFIYLICNLLTGNIFFNSICSFPLYINY